MTTVKSPYTPKPIATSGLIIPGELQELIEQLAENNHDNWAAQRFSDGWTWGPMRDDAKLHHPGLVPYDELSESEKEYDRRTVVEALKAIIALGFTIKKA